MYYLFMAQAVDYGALVVLVRNTAMVSARGEQNPRPAGHLDNARVRKGVFAAIFQGRKFHEIGSICRYTTEEGPHLRNVGVVIHVGLASAAAPPYQPGFVVAGHREQLEPVDLAD